MTINTLIVFVFILIGLVGYLHFQVLKMKNEIEQIWTQVATLVISTANKMSELKKEQDKIKYDENRK